VGQDAEEDFQTAVFGKSRAQGREQAPLVLREGGFDVVALSVLSLEEPSAHLSSVSGLRPLAAPDAGIEGDDGQAHVEAVSREPMIGFAVKGRVADGGIHGGMSAGLAQERRPEHTFVSGAAGDPDGQPEVGVGMAGDGQLGPIALPTGCATTAGEVVAAGVPRF